MAWERPEASCSRGHGRIALPIVPADLFHRFLPQALPVAQSLAPDDETNHARRVTIAAATASGAVLREPEILAALERLPPLPAVVRRILAMVGNDQASASDLGALVQLDLVVCAKLLKLVNSPFYGLSFHVTSVAQAVAMIGFGGVRSLVVAASLSEVLVQQLEIYGFSPPR